MQMETFMSSYPDRVLDTEDFNKIIFQKKEFNDLKLSEIQPEVPEDEMVFHHQKIIARFLSSFTLYDELFLFHSPGTGKTITAIHTIENIMNTQPLQFKKAVIIVPNETLVEKFKWEIIFTGTKNKYYTENKDEERLLSPKERKEYYFKQGKKNIRSFYWVTTHERFYNSLKKIQNIPGKIKSSFSNTILVIDEVHRLLSNDDWYSVYKQCINEMENRKILLMSGTPMKNASREMAMLMNLILPSDEQLRTGTEFDTEYLDPSGHIRMEWRDVFSRLFTGRISYLKSKPNIPFKYIGRQVENITYPLLTTEMSSFQEQVYSQVVNTAETFYKNSLQASLFVFPDQTYGMSGFTKHVKEKRDGRFTCPLLQSLQNKERREKEEFLKIHAPKFLNVILNVLQHPKKNTFIYSYFMKGSGAILLGLCLELFGFTRTYHGNVETKKPRYAILSDSIGTNISSVIRTFNQYKNRNGEYIQVLIGGKQVEEGITFYSIQQIHVLTPTWNFSSLDQAVARSIRLRSHRYLPPQTNVNIYLHAIMSSMGESTDLQLYKLSQEKDYSIKEMEYIIKVSAFDCALTMDRNYENNGINGSRECEYTDCVYRCNGMNPSEPFVLDKSTYQIHYQNEYIPILKQLLQRIFKTNFYITMYEIMEELGGMYTEYQICSALQSIIHSSITFTNKYGFISYLHEYNNIFFLTTQLTDTHPLTSFYSEYPYSTFNVSFLDVVDYLQQSEEVLNKQIEQMCALPLEERQAEILNANPLIQESFIENAIVAETPTPLTVWILEQYAPYIQKSATDISSSFLKTHIRNWNVSKQQWETIPVDTERQLLRLIQSPLGIYGHYNGKGQFSITDLHDIPMESRIHESSKRGKVCTSYTQGELYKITQKLGIPNIRVDEKKGILCKILEEWMKQQSLVV